MKKVAITFLGLLLVFGAFKIAGNFYKTEDNSLEKRLLRLAAEKNNNLPLDIDDNTRCEKVYAQGKSLIYHFSFSSLDRNKDDLHAIGKVVEREQKINAVKALCDVEKIRELLEEGLVYKYFFFDKSYDNSHFAYFTLDRADCRL